METGAEINFILQTVELGEDTDGDQVTTCIIREATREEMEEVHNDARPQGQNQKLFRANVSCSFAGSVSGPNPTGRGGQMRASSGASTATRFGNAFGRQNHNERTRNKHWTQTIG